MIRALVVASRLNLLGWFRGGMAAFISGGSGSVGAMFGSMWTDPEHFVPGNDGGSGHLRTLMLTTFCFSGVIGLCAYLQQHPLPEDNSAGES